MSVTGDPLIDFWPGLVLNENDPEPDFTADFRWIEESRAALFQFSSWRWFKELDPEVKAAAGTVEVFDGLWMDDNGRPAGVLPDFLREAKR